ncbi:sodium-coupled neutral amino acid transporter [Vairimorpha necatrix]|uniref:Sodium-coupled neutral amino acid transporter n=1 Tax=Vairimorpha necatrix TaxID=6039 RepID=A0AAX4JBR2_9MICR
MKSSIKELSSIYINLLKTTMGCGILNYPMLMKEFGVIQCIILTIFSSLASYAGIVIYIELNDKYGKNNTLSTVTRHFKPQLKILADIIVIFKCYTVAIAYLIYIKQQIVFLLDHYKLDLNINITFFIIVLLISPFVFMNKLDKLKYTSVLGLITILLLISTSYYRYISREIQHKLYLFRESDQYLQSLSYFVFSFTCHQNIFTLQNEMRYSSTRNLKITALLSLLSASTIYLIFGLISYMAYGEEIVKPFINTHKNDNIKVALSWFYIFLLGLSVPLQTNPVKQYSLNLINEKFLKYQKYGYIRFITSGLIIISCYFIAITCNDFDQMCKFIGGTFSTFMCFLFAGLYYILSMKVIGSKTNTMMAILSTTYGILAFCSVLKN